MTLRTRLAASFAIIALGTAAAVALAIPIVVGQGFQQLETVIRSESLSPTPSLQPTASPVPTPTPRSTNAPRSSCDPEHRTDACVEWSSPGTTQPMSPTPSTQHDTWPSAGAEPSHGWSAVPDRSPTASPWSDPHGWSGSGDRSQTRSTSTDAVGLVLAVAQTTLADPSSPTARIVAAGLGSIGTPEADSTTTSAADVSGATILKLVLVALGAAIVASLLGLLAADRLVRPLHRLQGAASAVARGEFDARSGLAARSDEIGDLARSFDTMAGALQAADGGRRRFLADAVHELRTPLTVIEATASAVIDGVYEPEPRHLETIRAQARLLSRVVDDLRTISLAEAHALELRREPVDAGAALRDAVDGFGARAERDGIRLGLEAPQTLVAEADPERLRQMLGALIDNAIRHTPSGGTITLAGSATDGVVRFDVRDSGPGVAGEDLAHVFERFYQADPSRDRARGSSGLGLAIVKALAEAHGGAVGAENAPQGGADFWIEIPAA